jgi:hypothetical protein
MHSKNLPLADFSSMTNISVDYIDDIAYTGKTDPSRGGDVFHRHFLASQ